MSCMSCTRADRLTGKSGRAFPVIYASQGVYLGAMLKPAPEKPSPPTDPRNVESCTIPLFALKGACVGPLLVVTGTEELLQCLSDRLYDLPGLRRMRGALVLRPNELEAAKQDASDATLELAGSADDAGRAYFQVLGRMTALGMINGRGVPERWVA